MNPFSFKNLLLTIFLLIANQIVIAQCDPSNPYDKIISGYHSSIAVKSNGVYSDWALSSVKEHRNKSIADRKAFY